MNKNQTLKYLKISILQVYMPMMPTENISHQIPNLFFCLIFNTPILYKDAYL